MYLALPNNKKLAKVTSPIKGDIVMSPTGYGNGYVSNGHVRAFEALVAFIAGHGSYSLLTGGTAPQPQG
jgi:hypothetical protein